MIKAIATDTFVHGASTYRPGDQAEFSRPVFASLAGYGLVRDASEEAPKSGRRAAARPANKKAPEPDNKKAPEPDNKATQTPAGADAPTDPLQAAQSPATEATAAEQDGQASPDQPAA